MFNFQTNNSFDSFNKNPEVISKSYGDSSSNFEFTIPKKPKSSFEINENQKQESAVLPPFPSPKAPEIKDRNFGKVNSSSNSAGARQREFSIDNNNEFASLTSELDKRNKAQNPQSPPLNDMPSTSKPNTLFTFPKSNFTY